MILKQIEKENLLNTQNKSSFDTNQLAKLNTQNEQQTQKVKRPNKIPHQYRADLDGLRTFAMMLIVIRHIRPSTFVPGFSGVTIFLVISGYVVSGIMYREIYQTGKLSHMGFLNRRIKRIIPSYLFFLALAITLLCLYYKPYQIQFQIQSVISACLMGQNLFLFYHKITKSPYFWNIVFITWTLGVEEQFYLVFPSIAKCLMKIKSKTRGVIFLLSIIIPFYLVAVVLQLKYSSEYFFMLPVSRGIQLLVGCLLGYWQFHENKKKAEQTQIVKKQTTLFERTISKDGLLSIFGFVLFMSKDLDYFLIFPIIGVSLMIRRQTGFLNQYILKHPVCLYIGKISYAIYLFHVLIANLLDRVGVIEEYYSMSVAFVVAILLTKFVENPIRANKWKYTSLILVGILMIILMIAIMIKQNPERWLRQKN